MSSRVPRVMTSYSLNSGHNNVCSIISQKCQMYLLFYFTLQHYFFEKKLKREGSKFSLFGLSQKEQWSATFLPFSLLPPFLLQYWKYWKPRTLATLSQCVFFFPYFFFFYYNCVFAEQNLRSRKIIEVKIKQN